MLDFKSVETVAKKIMQNKLTTKKFSWPYLFLVEHFNIFPMNKKSASNFALMIQIMHFCKKFRLLLLVLLSSSETKRALNK
jgi:hypothetical protein